MKTPTLYVSDMDGTLLNNGSYVSDLSAHIISELTAEGALITVATARTPATVVPLMEMCDTALPYIVMTGAATFSRETMSYGNLHTMTAEDAANALALFSRSGLRPFVYTFDDNGLLTVWHESEMDRVERDFYEARSHLKLKHFTFEHRDETADVALMFGTGPTELAREAAERFKADGRFSVSCYPDIFNRGISLIEVFSAGVSKASAILEMARRHGCGRIVAFGDNKNDLPMFEVADVAVAVSNANPSVLERADVVIGPNYDDSVARFMADDFNSR